MFDIVATVLAYFYDFTHSYGGAIMLLTSAIMVLLTPLTLKGTRSMIAMQRLQPEMKKLQNRYKDDRQKLNEEMLKFYKENNINPVGGCLPLIIQMPVFFVLYRVLIGLTDRAPYGDSMGRAFGLAAGDPAAVFSRFGTFEPQHIDRSTKMFEDLSNVSKMESFGLDLADTASHVFSQGLSKAFPYLALIALIGVTAWFQQKQIQGRTPEAQSQINPQQQMIMKIMPFFLPLISFTLPAGVTLYFLVSNLYRIAQQAFITRTMYSGATSGRGAIVDTTSTEVAPARGGILSQLKELTNGGASTGPTNDGPSRPAAPKSAPSKGATKAKPVAKREGASGRSAKPAPRRQGSPPGPAPSKSGRPNAKVGNSGSTRPPKGAFAAPGSAGKATPPSRSAPEPNPNRSRTKKKRK